MSDDCGEDRQALTSFMKIRLEMCAIFGKPIKNLSLPWDDAPGAVAHLLENAYRAFPPHILRRFLVDNKHHLPPAVFNKIMGIGNDGTISTNGLFWCTGPTAVGVAIVNRLHEGFHSVRNVSATGTQNMPQIGSPSSTNSPASTPGPTLEVVLEGACNMTWFLAWLDKPHKVKAFDVFPSGRGVEFGDPCVSHVDPSSADVVLFACSFPGPSSCKATIQTAFVALKPGGFLVVTNVKGHDKPSMDACATCCQLYVKEGAGEVVRFVVKVDGQREVDCIVFKRVKTENTEIEVNMPQRDSVKVYKATKCTGHADELQKVDGNMEFFTSVELDNKTSIMRFPAVYGMCVTEHSEGNTSNKRTYIGYIGSSLDAPKRVEDHKVGKGNEHIKRALDQNGTAEDCIIIDMGDVHQSWFECLMGGNKPTVWIFDFLLRFMEQHTIAAMKKMCDRGTFGAKMINQHISGYSHGVQAHAVENGKLGAKLSNATEEGMSQGEHTMKNGKISMPSADRGKLGAKLSNATEEGMSQGERTMQNGKISMSNADRGKIGKNIYIRSRGSSGQWIKFSTRKNCSAFFGVSFRALSRWMRKGENQFSDGKMFSEGTGKGRNKQGKTWEWRDGDDEPIEWVWAKGEEQEE